MLQLISVLSATGLSLYVRSSTPLIIIADAFEDDASYARQGLSLVQGRWLGPFDRTTLAKLPGFPMFIALAHHVPMSYALSLQTLHLMAAATAAGAVWAMTRRRGLAVILYVVLALDPSTFGGAASRISREAWYSSVCLALFALVALTWHLTLDRARTLRHRLAFGLAGGLLIVPVAFAYWIGREEQIWLLPGLLAVVSPPTLRTVAAIWRARGEASWRTRVGAVLEASAGGLVALVVTVLGVSLLVGAVATANRTHYGSAIVVDNVQGSVPRALAAWESVDAGPSRRYVTLSEAQRQAVYAVSPTARRLEGELEGFELQQWEPPSCSVGVCDDLGTAWTSFAVRDAAARVGVFRTESNVQIFFGRLADEIEEACADGRLTCDRHTLPGGLPPLSRLSVGSLADAGWQNLRYLARFGLGAGAVEPSEGAPQNYAVFAQVIRGLPPTLADEQARERTRSPTARRVLVDVYSAIGPWASLLTGLAMITAAVRRRRSTGTLLVLAVGALVVVLTRAGLLALLDVSAFHAATGSYALASSPFVDVAIVLGLASSGWSSVRSPAGESPQPDGNEQVRAG